MAHRTVILGGGCVHGNCGYVCPSHVLPLTVPGIIRDMGLKAFSKKPPPYAEPRLSPALMAWMLRFARNCTEDQMMRAARALAPMLDASRTLSAEIIEREIDPTPYRLARFA